MKGAIPDWEWINWEGRRVVVAYDADAVTKELVRVARSELAANLRGRGALVGFLEWDLAGGKGSMIISPSWDPTRSSMRSRASTSPVQRGGRTCCAPNRL